MRCPSFGSSFVSLLPLSLSVSLPPCLSSRPLPSPLLVSSYSPGQLGDFGIAKVLQNTRDNARTQIGTPYYLSPEICEDKPYSFRSDVWAMGIILFEMLALRVPFEARDLRALVRKIVQAPVPKLPAAFQKPPELQLLVTDLLAKNPQRRPDIAEVLNKAIVKSAVHTINELDTEKAGAALKRTFTKTTSLDVHRKVEKRHPPQHHQQHHQHQHQQQQQHHQQHQHQQQQQQVQLQQKHGQRRHPQQQQEQQQQRRLWWRQATTALLA